MTEFAVTMSHINQQAVKVNQKVAELFGKVDALIGQLPAFVANRIIPLTTKLQELLGKAWKEMKAFIEEPGDWGVLDRAGKLLSDKVQSSVSSQAGHFVDTYSRVDDHWQGPAAEAYKKVLKPGAPQNAALKQYASTVKAASEALDLCRWTLIGFWGAVGAAYAVLIYKLAEACGAAASGVGIPVALGNAIAGIGVFVAAVAAAAWTAVQIMGGAASTFRTENNGNDNWPDGKWPPSGVVAH